MLAAVGASLKSDEPAVVHGAVDQRGGHVLVAEHASPAGELDVITPEILRKLVEGLR